MFVIRRAFDMCVEPRPFFPSIEPKRPGSVKRLRNNTDHDDRHECELLRTMPERPGVNP